MHYLFTFNKFTDKRFPSDHIWAIMYWEPWTASVLEIQGTYAIHKYLSV